MFLARRGRGSPTPKSAAYKAHYMREPYGHASQSQREMLQFAAKLDKLEGATNLGRW
jgi:hypothetical protein